MLYFIPWVLLFVAVIVAVIVAAMMSPSAGYSGGGGSEDVLDEYSEEGEEGAVLVDDFAAEGEVEPMGDDAFAEFN